MNWTEVEKMIAERIIKKRNVVDKDGKIRELLIEAVREGLKYECNNWIGVKQ